MVILPEGFLSFVQFIFLLLPAEDMPGFNPKESNNQTTTSNIHINILFNYRRDQDKDAAMCILFTVIQTSFKICVYNPVFVE